MNDELKIFKLYLESAANTQPKLKMSKKGNKRWYLHGQLHRDGAPAIEHPNGGRMWYQHGKLHRDDGPAVENENGSKFWFLHGEYHREDGPAVELTADHKEWWLHNVRYRSPEAWAEALLKQRNEPHDAMAVDAFLKTLLRKDIEMAL